MNSFWKIVLIVITILIIGAGFFVSNKILEHYERGNPYPYNQAEPINFITVFAEAEKNCADVTTKEEWDSCKWVYSQLSARAALNDLAAQHSMAKSAKSMLELSLGHSIIGFLTFILFAFTFFQTFSILGESRRAANAAVSAEKAHIYVEFDAECVGRGDEFQPGKIEEDVIFSIRPMLANYGKNPAEYAWFRITSVIHPRAAKSKGFNKPDNRWDSPHEDTFALVQPNRTEIPVRYTYHDRIDLRNIASKKDIKPFCTFDVEWEYWDIFDRTPKSMAARFDVHLDVSQIDKDWKLKDRLYVTNRTFVRTTMRDPKAKGRIKQYLDRQNKDAERFHSELT